MDLKTKRTICLMVGIISILTIVGTISYAYFTATANMVPVEATFTTGTARVRFADNDLGFNAELNFGESVTKKFTIENTGTVDANVKMYWDKLLNTYLEGSLTYTLSYAPSEDGPYTQLISKTNVPRSRVPSTEVLANSLTIPVGQTYYYNLEITLNYLSDVNQDADLNAVFNTYFKVVDINQPDPSRTLMAVTNSYTGEIWGHKEDIKQIVFESSISPKSDAVYTYDLSAKQDSSVMSYLVPDSTDTTKYVAYIQADGDIRANPNSSYLFYNFTTLENIDNLALLDISEVTNIAQMFGYCKSLTTLDVSNFDTSSVTNMQGMFAYCNNLTTVDVSNFDTGNVTNMWAMFIYCNNLTALDVSNFDTSNVTAMINMFAYCNNLTALDVSNFNTSNVTTMYSMFGDCSSLTTLDVSNFDTSNVTTMGAMFSGCSSLTTLNVSNFNTSNVTSMSVMFSNCTNLTTLDVSNFDTSNVTAMGAMFSGCSSLTTLNVSNFDTSNVTAMNSMFADCSNLTTLNLSNFDTSNVTSMNSMFYGCSNLTTTITIRGTNLNGNYVGMFSGASTATGSKITVNYTANTSILVTNMIATKSSNSNVVKDSVVS